MSENVESEAEAEESVTVASSEGPLTMSRAEYSARFGAQIMLPKRVELPNISDRQFFHGLWKRGLITDAEVIDAVSIGAIPAPMQTVLDSPDFENQLAAMNLSRMDVLILLKGAKEFEFNHPVTPVFAAVFGWNSEQFQEFWNFCLTL